VTIRKIISLKEPKKLCKTVQETGRLVVFPEKVESLDFTGKVCRTALESWMLDESSGATRGSSLSKIADIQLGNVFGKGGFFIVSEVKSITFQPDENDAPPDNRKKKMLQDEDRIHAVVQDRAFMQQYCIRNGTDCRYAFKTMQDAGRDDPSTFVDTIVDLAIECKFLASVRHPNIIKMRAMSMGDMCHPNAFIILDRLYDTLQDRIEQWKKRDSNGINKLFDFQKKRQKQFFAERLTVAYDVASALAYLHDIK